MRNVITLYLGNGNRSTSIFSFQFESQCFKIQIWKKTHYAAFYEFKISAWFAAHSQYWLQNTTHTEIHFEIWCTFHIIKNVLLKNHLRHLNGLSHAYDIVWFQVLDELNEMWEEKRCPQYIHRLLRDFLMLYFDISSPLYSRCSSLIFATMIPLRKTDIEFILFISPVNIN